MRKPTYDRVHVPPHRWIRGKWISKIPNCKSNDDDDDDDDDNDNDEDNNDDAVDETLRRAAA